MLDDVAEVAGHAIVDKVQNKWGVRGCFLTFFSLIVMVAIAAWLLDLL